MYLDESGLVCDGLGFFDGGTDFVIACVAVLDPNRVPAKGFEPGADVFGEGNLSVTVNGDVVVIVEGDQFAQAPVARQRARFIGDALHLAPVSEDDVAAMIPGERYNYDDDGGGGGGKTLIVDKVKSSCLITM